jgi:hypothetical protein
VIDKLDFRAKNSGAAQSHIIACNALADLVKGDPRVEQLYEEWRRASGLTELLDGMRDQRGAAAVEDLRAEFVMRYYASGVAYAGLVVPPFVAKELRLPYPWLAVQLSAAFLVRIANEATGVNMLGLAVGVVAPQGAAKGRRAKGGGDSIRRGVEWFYRHHVQQPNESVRSLAKEHVRNNKSARTSDARAIVFDGIRRAKALLDQADYIYAPLPE